MSCSKLLQPPSSFTYFRRSSEPVMTGRPRIRRIIHQFVESGTARLIYDKNCHTLRGVLLNRVQDTFSIFGRITNSHEDGLDKLSSQTETQMHFTIIDCESGEHYELEHIPIQLSELVNPVTASSHVVVNIDHPAIKFQSKDVLIGNRADVEISQYIDPKLSPSFSKKVLIGPMSLKVTTREKNEPTLRRMSESVTFGTDVVIEHTNDFLA